MAEEENPSKGQKIAISSTKNRAIASEQALPPAKAQPRVRNIGSKLSVMPCACLLPKIAELGTLTANKANLERRYYEITQSRSEERSREQIAEESMLSQVVGWLRDAEQ